MTKITAHAHSAEGMPHTHAVIGEVPADPVNHPAHYTNSGFEYPPIECIHFTRHLGFCEGNAFKYVWRAGLKGDWKQDLDKARWYLTDCMDAEIEYFRSDSTALDLLLMLETDALEGVWAIKYDIFMSIAHQDYKGALTDISSLEFALKDGDKNG